VDFDYHHGNGTEAIAGRGVSYVSTHADPAYPGTGQRSYRLDSDVVANVPLPASGISTEAFMAVWEDLLPRVAEAVRPDLVLVSAGFDYAAGDCVGDLGVESKAAEGLAAVIEVVARRHCRGRVAYALEGGYDLDVLTESIEAIASVTGRGRVVFSGADPAAIPSRVRSTLREISYIAQGGEPGVAN
jgi:acetoin utilization deacetylase AcuC-like enzyme